jgi:hypothetical protein
LRKQVGNPTLTTSHLKRRETKDAHGSAHFIIFKWVFTRFGTYVQRGSKFCFVVVLLLLLGVTVIAQNIALLANFTMHSAA